jgi:hypothetical protein
LYRSVQDMREKRIKTFKMEPVRDSLFSVGAVQVRESS